MRERVWSVLTDWHRRLGQGSLVMIWADTAQAGMLGLRSLGHPPKDVVPHEGNLLVRRRLSSDTQDTCSLKS